MYAFSKVQHPCVCHARKQAPPPGAHGDAHRGCPRGVERDCRVSRQPHRGAARLDRTVAVSPIDVAWVRLYCWVLSVCYPGCKTLRFLSTRNSISIAFHHCQACTSSKEFPVEADSVFVGLQRVVSVFLLTCVACVCVCAGGDACVFVCVRGWVRVWVCVCACAGIWVWVWVWVYVGVVLGVNCRYRIVQDRRHVVMPIIDSIDPDRYQTGCECVCVSDGRWEKVHIAQ